MTCKNYFLNNLQAENKLQVLIEINNNSNLYLPCHYHYQQRKKDFFLWNVNLK